MRLMEPHMVDEFMRAVWDRRYTQKDADDHVKRTKKMLAKVGDPIARSTRVPRWSNQTPYPCRTMCPTLRIR